jgi:transcription elongation factor GreA
MDMITVEEKAQLEAKLKDLHAKRPQISERIAEARALGDLKENAEYHAAREDQGMNEAEIRRIEERLASARVVDREQVPDDVVFIGATVKLRDEDGDEDVFRLVGESSGASAAESDVVEVTATSPMGEALMKARVGETIKVDAPRGTLRFEIVEIL